MQLHRTLFLAFLITATNASLGDRLPEFKTCVNTCITANCDGDNPTPIPLHRRLLFWSCPSECDHACQHMITNTRLAREPPYLQPVLQFHGKWPFHRFMGMQEPFSVFFSLLNFLAHYIGLKRLRDEIPTSYKLRRYYILFGYFGLISWVCSMIFHTRDFSVTEKLDYFAAGASVLYGLFFAPIRVFRLDKSSALEGKSATVIRAWAALCVTLYVMHVGYLSLVRFDYTYNMAANVVVGVIQNVLWTAFSIRQYKKIGRLWAAWPGLIVAWVITAMSLELFDFPPWKGMIDAHALWHAATVAPTVWWYNFLIKDAQQDLMSVRLKA
ncbi:Mn2+ homeostasis protein-like protein Per1 [Piedraia hortae CBS 480.64]|uniref:Post-GPI attachment to proteins factor 3 n=1 Tax=Piedraia hortae CBS 480.64 TaxID=1314780 RepID=A0A6A7BYL6_9PEZI|nr:Mn2+ homeostasis protein-like protein Per1 [Piedraia hortae CBS 480.64]